MKLAKKERAMERARARVNDYPPRKNSNEQRIYKKVVDRQTSLIKKKETNGESSFGSNANRKLAESNRKATNSRAQALQTSTRSTVGRALKYCRTRHKVTSIARTA